MSIISSEGKPRPARASLPAGLVARLLRRAMVELGPALVFFGVFAWKGLIIGTAAFMAASVLSVTLSVVRDHSLPTAPLIVAGVILVLGGLTLVLEDHAFIKLHPTVVNGLFAMAIAGGRTVGHDLVKSSFGGELSLTETGWRRLSWRLAAYLALLAIANEIVWRVFSTGTWITFKTFVILGCNIAFLVLQLRLIRTHAAPTDGLEVADGTSGPA